MSGVDSRVDSKTDSRPAIAKTETVCLFMVSPPPISEKNPPGMPGQDNKSVHLSDCLPTIAVCGGVFVVGVVVLILFKRKKDLKPPKENKTE